MPFASGSLPSQFSSWKENIVQENGQNCLEVWRLQLKPTSECEHAHLGQ